MKIEEAVFELKQIRDVYANIREEYKSRVEALDTAINVLEAHEWIPCKDRLPEQEQRVLINLSDGDTSVGWILRGDIWFTDYSCGKPEDEVVAWMPRPKPYKAERKTDE